MVDRFYAFTHLLHKNVPFRWDDKCEEDFNKLKEYLMNPPVLMSPIEGKPLLLYILATKVSLGVLLVQQDHEGKERVIYYISRNLVRYEINYRSVEKSCLAISKTTTLYADTFSQDDS